jgi:chemotaxis signal transduction protein
MSDIDSGCWRRIGVYGGGDQSCERLPEVLHCRNCPVFRAAARTLLVRESPALPADVATQSQRAEVEQASLLLLRLRQQWLGLPPAILVEIAAVGTIRRLAHRAHGLLEGIVGVRGELHLCVALSELLDLGARTPSGSGTERLVLVRNERGMVLAFRADEVRGLAHFDPSALLAPPDALSPHLGRALAGVVDLAVGRVGVLAAEPLTTLLDEALFR